MQISISGDLADELGARLMDALGLGLAGVAGAPVVVLVQGPSEYHKGRVTLHKPTFAMRRRAAFAVFCDAVLSEDGFGSERE